MDYGNGNQSYTERNARTINLGEQLFEDWCKSNEYGCYRIGYDEKTGIIDGWYKVAQSIRQMPDYLVTKGNRMAVVSVKGTLKFKAQDFNRLDWYEETYGTDECPFRFVFSTRDRIIWLTTAQVREAYEASTNVGVWPDGKQWRELNLNALGI